MQCVCILYAGLCHVYVKCMCVYTVYVYIEFMCAVCIVNVCMCIQCMMVFMHVVCSVNVCYTVYTYIHVCRVYVCCMHVHAV